MSQNSKRWARRLVQPGSSRQAQLRNSILEALEKRWMLSSVTFASPVSYAVSAPLFAATTYALTSDGILDIATNNIDGTVSVLLGNGNGTFQSAHTYPDGLNAETGGYSQKDFAVANLGNGHPDLLVANETSSDVSVLLGNGDGSFASPQELADGDTYGVTAIAAADLGNGAEDLVAAHSDGAFAIFLGNGNGTFKSGHAVATGQSRLGESLGIADFNGDGLPDLAFDDGDNYTAVIMYGDGDGTFAPPQPIAAAGTLVDQVQTPSLNGHPDLLVRSTNGTLDLLLGNGDGSFAAPVQLIDVSPDTIGGDVVGVFSGDGIPDILGATSGGSFWALFGNGNGTFQPAQSFSVTHGGADASQLTGDGEDDLVGGAMGSPIVYVVLNTSPPFVVLSGGTLTITGTPSPDSISVTDNAGSVTAVLNGDSARPFTGVARIAVSGGAGDDTISAAAMPISCTIGGAGGNDSITGGAMADSLRGGAGNDTIGGAGGNDTIVGGGDDDSLKGGAGNDFIAGGPGNNTIHGGTGNDSIISGAGDNVVNGNAGNDTIVAGVGNSQLFAGGGADQFLSGLGNSTVFGGSGDLGDTYFDGSAGGALTIEDFMSIDAFKLTGGLTVSNVAPSGGGTIVTLSDGTQITIANGLVTAGNVNTYFHS